MAANEGPFGSCPKCKGAYPRSTGICSHCGQHVTDADLAEAEARETERRAAAQVRAQAKAAAIHEFKGKMAEVSRDGWVDDGEQKELQELANRLGLSQADVAFATEPERRAAAQARAQAKAAALQQFKGKIAQVSLDGRLDDEEQRELQELADRLGLSQADVASTTGNLWKLKLMADVEKGNLPTADDVPILLPAGEICHFEWPADLFEERKKTRMVGGSTGFSIPLGKGVRWRVGAFAGQPVTSVDTVRADSGSLYVTNKRVIFSGATKNVTYPIKKIVAVTPASDSIRFVKENDKTPKTFSLGEPWVVDLVGLMVTHLASR